MKKLYSILLIALLAITASAQFDTLELIDQISGAASACVEYAHGRLYVGAGSSMFIYQSDDPANMVFLGGVDFLSLVTNIVVRDDSTVFVGANHDALYAVDASQPDFPVVARYKMPDRSHWVADLEISPPDTLWLSDYTSLKKMIFTGDTFLVAEEYLSGSLIAGAGFRDTLVAVCRRGILTGYVDLYNRAGGGFTHVCTFDSSRLWYVVDAEFADNRDDIIYVLGGSPNLGVDGDFYALHLIDDSLYVAAGYKFSGVPMFAQTFIMNMDSKNDTVFLATMAAIYWHPSWDSTWSDCPAIDCTFLPDSMPIIGHFVPGLWFFDVALHDELPALATASEWLGVWWTSIADFSERLDTIRTYPTGGWGQHSYLYGGDTLYVAMEGYGVQVLDVRDLEAPEKIGRIPGSFAHDMAFLDSIICVARSSQFIFFNLAPFWRGGEIEPLDTFVIPLVFGETHICHSLGLMKTEDDTLFLLATSNEGVNVIDPRDLPEVYTHALFFDGTDPLDIHCFGDTMFVLMADSLHIARYLGDSIEHILDIPTAGEATGLYREDDFVAITCKNPGLFWFEWTGDTLIEVGSWDPWGFCADIERFDSLIYVVCAGEGLFILDIDSFPAIDTLAHYPGSQGWEFLQYGSQHVSFGADSTIFLTDYHAACYILEAFKRGDVGISEITHIRPDRTGISAWPNPFNSSVTISLSVIPGSIRPYGSSENPVIEIFDINGRRVDVVARRAGPDAAISQINRSSVPLDTRRDAVSINNREFVWQPDESLGSGVYLIRARFGTLSDQNACEISRRVVYLK